jgi:Protein kinase domain
MATEVVRSQTENLPDHVIEHFWYGPDIPCALSVMCRGRRFYIEFRAKDLREPQNHPVATKLEKDFLRLLRATEDDQSDCGSLCNSVDGCGSLDGDDSHVCPDDILYHWILKPFKPVFRQLAPTHTTPRLTTLFDALKPPLLPFTIRTIKGQLTALPNPTVPESLYNLTLPTNTVSNLPPIARAANLPLIKPQSLRIAPTSPSQPQNPNVVFHNAQPTYFKRISRGAEDATITEINALLRIQTLDPSHKLRVPRLLALVQDPEGCGNNLIIGVLLTLINEGGDLGTLAENASTSLKRRWYDTVVQTVKILHSDNIIWGDVKADNVLIDRQQNAWLIDFGGGVTWGWVDEEFEGTKQGDLQGLKRLKEFLELESGSRGSSASGVGSRTGRTSGGGLRNKSATRNRSDDRSGSGSGKGGSGTRSGSRSGSGSGNGTRNGSAPRSVSATRPGSRTGTRTGRS